MFAPFMGNDKLEFDDSSSTSSEAVVLHDENINKNSPQFPNTLDITHKNTTQNIPSHEFEFEIDRLEDKPWLRAGSDITDYFNYGFDENTWRVYCARQKEIKENYCTNVNYSKKDMEAEYNKHREDNGKKREVKRVRIDESMKRRFDKDSRNEKDEKFVDSRYNSKYDNKDSKYDNKDSKYDNKDFKYDNKDFKYDNKDLKHDNKNRTYDDRRTERFEDGRRDYRFCEDKQYDRFGRKDYKYNEDKFDDKKREQRFLDDRRDRKYTEMQKSGRIDDRNSKHKDGFDHVKMEDERRNFRGDEYTKKDKFESRRYNDERKGNYKR